MIDIETEVFNSIVNALREQYGDGISVSGEYVEMPERFPFVSIVEDDNSEVETTKTLDRSPETACNLMYTVNAYSNLKTSKKSQAKAILDAVDGCMHELGFTRTMRSQLPNVDRTIYRVTARYTRVLQIFE